MIAATRADTTDTLDGHRAGSQSRRARHAVQIVVERLSDFTKYLRNKCFFSDRVRDPVSCREFLCQGLIPKQTRIECARIDSVTECALLVRKSFHVSTMRG